MKAVFKVFLCFMFLSLSFMVFNIKAETINELQTKFLALGGSQDAFNKIISVVQQAEKNNEDLKSKINDIYDVQLYSVITADNFDVNKYQQIYNNINQDKADLLSKNLSEITKLLSSLSVNDRKAYAGLLFIDMIPTNNSTNQVDQSTTDNKSSLQSSNNSDNNTDLSQKLGNTSGASNSTNVSNSSSSNDVQKNSNPDNGSSLSQSMDADLAKNN